ncbi:MAG: hypothetical protein QW395_06895, partial [Candidatus Nitrosotenuis sp.]
MFKGFGSLNWKLQLLFNAIAIVSVVAISIGGYTSANQLAEKVGNAEAKELLDSIALQAIVLGVIV